MLFRFLYDECHLRNTFEKIILLRRVRRLAFPCSVPLAEPPADEPFMAQRTETVVVSAWFQIATELISISFYVLK